MTVSIARSLSTVTHSPLHKAYTNTVFCNDTLKKNNNGHLTGSYCKNRWCLVCNSNRIGKLIHEYNPILQKIEDKYFVTLTTQTVEGKSLKKRIGDMGKVWRVISSNNNNYKYIKTFNGIRKLEVTPRPGQRFHPHYHLIIEGKEAAEWLIDQWLKRWGRLANKKAQDMRLADDRSVNELFKYFTKMTMKMGDRDLSGNLFVTKDRQGQRVFSHSEDLDVIFRAIKGKRVFQSFGNVRKVSEEVDEKEKIVLPGGKEGEIWKWVTDDWISEFGECLTNYKPTDGMVFAKEHQGM